MTTHRHERAALLAARRDALVALAQVQRGTLALRLRGLEPTLHWAERGWRFWCFARAHVWTLWLPLAGLMVLRPRWAGRLGAGFIALSRAARWLR